MVIFDCVFKNASRNIVKKGEYVIFPDEDIELQIDERDFGSVITSKRGVKYYSLKLTMDSHDLKKKIQFDTTVEKVLFDSVKTNTKLYRLRLRVVTTHSY